MKSTLRILASTLFVLGLAGNCQLFADDADIPQLRVNDPKLRDHIGKEIVVYGRVSRANRSSSGHEFLNFDDNRKFSAVCFKNDQAAFKDGTPATKYRNRTVEIRGKLEEYRDKLQIKLRRPDQIRERKTDSPTKKLDPVELKSIGKEAWISPAGVRYVGRDPEGRTRVEHILRHARDDPKREGPHGVFDGGEDLVFAVVDDAWKTIKEKKLRPRDEGDRSTFLVSMGRRIGYLGGMTGAERGKPELTRVFIVVRTGTSEVITAFPR